MSDRLYDPSNWRPEPPSAPAPEVPWVPVPENPPPPVRQNPSGEWGDPEPTRQPTPPLGGSDW